MKYLYAMLAASVLFLAGCQDQGPAQEAGEAIDDAATDVRDALRGQGPAESAGESIDETIDEWTEND